jgi:hypothetical protein
MPKIVIGRALRFSVSKSAMKLHLKLGTFLHVYGIVVLNPMVRTLGILSRCKDDEDGCHSLFLDYDDAMIAVVHDDIKRIQRQYDAGTAVILKTGESDFNIAGNEYGSWHVLFPAKFLFEEVVEIISKTHCDYNFRDVSRSFNWRAYCLRIYPKYSEDGALIRERPTLHDVIWAETGREVYRALYEFLYKYYDMPEWEGLLAPRLDNLTSLSILHYNTTEGWNMAINKRLKSSLRNIKMHLKVFGGANGFASAGS